MLGRRRSASIRRTRVPFCARTTAVLMLVVVLPSRGRALVTKIVFGGAPREVRSKEVRKARYDSAICDCGRECVTNSTGSFSLPPATTKLRFDPLSELFLVPKGINPSDGSP